MGVSTRIQACQWVQATYQLKSSQFGGKRSDAPNNHRPENPGKIAVTGSRVCRGEHAFRQFSPENSGLYDFFEKLKITQSLKASSVGGASWERGKPLERTDASAAELSDYEAKSNVGYLHPPLRILRLMTPFHDEVFFEIDSARKLVAELKLRRSESAAGTQDSGTPDDVALKARQKEESGLAALAEARAERHEKDRAEARAHASEKAYRRLEAREILRELAEAQANERAAAEESIRKAWEKQDGASGVEPARHGSEPASSVRHMWFPGIGASHVWYFTAEGERRGPVTFKDLQTMAASRVLDPRLDLVWKKGSQEWRRAGLVDGLFERSSIRDEMRTKPTLDQVPVRSLRSSALMEKLASKDLHWPGVSRCSLLFGVLLFPVLWNQLLSFISPYLVSKVGTGLMGALDPVLAIVPPLVLIWLLLNRLVNVGMNRWWALAVVVPVLNLWVAFRCVFCPAGYAYHRRMDWNGVAMFAVLCTIAMFTWHVMFRHPIVSYGGYLQAGIRVAFERAWETVGSRL